MSFFCLCKLSERFNSFPKPEKTLLQILLIGHKLISYIGLEYCVFLVEKGVKILLIFYMVDFIGIQSSLGV